MVGALKAKASTDLADLQLKHQHNMQLIESKFRAQNELLNDEFLFLSGELQKLRDREAAVDASGLAKGTLVARQLDEADRVAEESLAAELRKRREGVAAKRQALVG